MAASNGHLTETLPPHVQLIQMSTDFLCSRALYAAAKLGLADHLADGPKRADELAEAYDFSDVDTMVDVGSATGERGGSHTSIGPGRPGLQHAVHRNDAPEHGGDACSRYVDQSMGSERSTVRRFKFTRTNHNN